jgi:DNA-binding NarL/FixJ family response regulator
MALIRVVLADDHLVVRAGLRMLLEKAADIRVVAEAGDGPEALRLTAELAPDVLLLDMELAGLSGVEVAQHIKQAGLPVQVLALSAYDDEQYIFGLLSSGAAGYLTKDEAPAVIIEAIRGVANNEVGWLSRRIAAKVLNHHSEQADGQPEQPTVLSAREQQVLQLLAQGYSNPQIAAELVISDGTVKNHVTNIYRKLGVRTRAEAVAWAWQQGFVNDSDSQR